MTGKLSELFIQKIVYCQVVYYNILTIILLHNNV